MDTWEHLEDLHNFIVLNMTESRGDPLYCAACFLDVLRNAPIGHEAARERLNGSYVEVMANPADRIDMEQEPTRLPPPPAHCSQCRREAVGSLVLRPK